MALLNPPAPTLLEPKTTTPDTAPRKEIAATAAPRRSPGPRCQYGEDDRRRSVLQHRDILLALTRRDEDLAEAAMRSHILAARYAAVRVADEPGS